MGTETNSAPRQKSTTYNFLVEMLWGALLLVCIVGAFVLGRNVGLGEYSQAHSRGLREFEAASVRLTRNLEKAKVYNAQSLAYHAKLKATIDRAEFAQLDGIINLEELAEIFNMEPLELAQAILEINPDLQLRCSREV